MGMPDREGARRGRPHELRSGDVPDHGRCLRARRLVHPLLRIRTPHRRDSWSRARRVIGKAQVGPKGENPRFVVTNLPGDLRRWESGRLYLEFHCARGHMENRTKEHQLDLFADRMSCEEMNSNQLRLRRLRFSTFPYLRRSGQRERASGPGALEQQFRFQSVVAGCWERLRAAPT